MRKYVIKWCHKFWAARELVEFIGSTLHDVTATVVTGIWLKQISVSCYAHTWLSRWFFWYQTVFTITYRNAIRLCCKNLWQSSQSEEHGSISWLSKGFAEVRDSIHWINFDFTKVTRYTKCGNCLSRPIENVLRTFGKERIFQTDIFNQSCDHAGH